MEILQHMWYLVVYNDLVYLIGYQESLLVQCITARWYGWEVFSTKYYTIKLGFISRSTIYIEHTVDKYMQNLFVWSKLYRIRYRGSQELEQLCCCRFQGPSIPESLFVLVDPGWDCIRSWHGMEPRKGKWPNLSNILHHIKNLIEPAIYRNWIDIP